jgi:hypothetical protein
MNLKATYPKICVEVSFGFRFWSGSYLFMHVSCQAEYGATPEWFIFSDPLTQ